MLGRQAQQRRPSLADAPRELQELPPGGHAVERDGNVVPAASRVHLSSHLASASLFEQPLDEKEEVLAGSVVTRGIDLAAIESIERTQKLAFLLGREDGLLPQHPRMGVMNLEQRI